MGFILYKPAKIIYFYAVIFTDHGKSKIGNCWHVL